MAIIDPIAKVGVIDPELTDVVPQAASVARTPYSELMDAAIKGLNDVSSIEQANNKLTLDYLQGHASMEAVMTSTNELSIAMQLAVTVVNNTTQTFKEIQQMQV